MSGETSNADRASPASSEPATLEYDAFLSYSTSADYRLVRRVQAFAERIHTLRAPETLALRELKLCVDGSDFSVSESRVLPPELHAAVQVLDDPKRRVVADRMARSRSMVIFCPGKSFHGDWMRWELEWFLAHRPDGGVFLAATGGNDPWGQPSDHFPSEIIAAGLHDKRFGYDLRGLRPRAARRFANVRDAEEEIVRLSADLMGKAAREVLPHWQRSERRRAQRVALIAILVAMVTIALAVAAWIMRDRAVTARALAERRARIAVARQLAAQTRTGGGPQAAVRLAVQAVKATTGAGEPVTHAAEQALRDALAAAGGRAIEGHTAPVRALAIDADGRWLLTGSSDGRAGLWSFDSDGIPASPVFLDHRSVVDWVGFAGARAITAARDHAVRVWEFADSGARRIQTLTLPAAIAKVAVSPSGRWLAIVTDGGGVQLWRVGDPATAARDLTPSIHATTATFTRDERWLVVHSNYEKMDGRSGDIVAATVALRYDLADPNTPPSRLEGHSARISSIAPAPAPLPPSVILSGGADGRVILWDVAAEQPRLTVLGAGGAVDAVTFSPDGRWAIAGEHAASARLWRLDASTRSGSGAIPLTGHGSPVKLLVPSRDSRWLATAGVKDSSVQLWDLSTEDPSKTGQTLRGHTQDVEVVQFTSRGQLVTTSTDRTVRVWDVDGTGRSATVLAGHEDVARVAAVTPDGRRLVVATGTDIVSEIQVDSTLRLWQLDVVQSSTYPVALRASHGNTSAEASSDATRVIMTGGDRALTFFDLSSARGAGPRAFRLGAMNDNISAILFTPDAKRLVVVAEDGEIARWDLDAADPLATRRRIARHRYPLLHAALDRSGDHVAAGDNESGGGIWSITQPGPLSPLVGPEGITALTYSTDGRFLAFGDHAKTVYLRVDAEARRLGTLAEPAALLRFSPDGRWLAAIPWYPHDGLLWSIGPDGTTGEPITITSGGARILPEAVWFNGSSSWLVWATDRTVRATRPGARDSIVLPGAASDVSVTRFVRASTVAVGYANGTIEVWRLSGSRVLVRNVAHADRIVSIEPVDDARFAAASQDGSIQLWDIEQGEDDVPIVLQPRSAVEVLWLATSSDGRWLTASTSDGVKVFPLRVPDLLAAARQVAPDRTDPP